MARHRILVVDDRLAVRETAALVLGRHYEVRSCAVADYSAAGAVDFHPHLIISVPGRLSRPAGVPVLWLEAPGTAASGVSSAPAILSPAELRERVQGLLAKSDTRLAGAERAARLTPPYVTSEAAYLLGLALTTRLPLHLVAPGPGSGARSLARAVHDGGGHGPWRAVSAADVDAALLADPAMAGGTLFIDGVDRLSRPVQGALLSALDPAGLLRTDTGDACRLITAAGTDLAAAVSSGSIAPDLYYRITAMAVRLVPLSERPEDILPLTEIVIADLAPRLGRGPMTITERAIDRLGNYLWFGDLAELESVLARTIALTPGTVIDAEDLLFEGTSLGRCAGATESRPGDGQAPTLGGHSFELMAHELAHELKNPLVALKTFTHCARTALADSADTAELARMAEEGVDRIDHLLENLLAFTRLTAPIPQAVPLAALLEATLAAAGDALSARGVVIDRAAVPHAAVRGDPEQLAYGLANLLDAATTGLAPGSRLAVRAEPHGALVFERPGGAEPLGSRLAALLGHPLCGPPALPLFAAMAAEVLRRNGTEVRVADDGTAVRILFTPAVAGIAEPIQTPPAEPRDTGRRGGSTVKLRGGR